MPTSSYEQERETGAAQATRYLLKSYQMAHACKYIPNFTGLGGPSWYLPSALPPKPTRSGKSKKCNSTVIIVHQSLTPASVSSLSCRSNNAEVAWDRTRDDEAESAGAHATTITSTELRVLVFGVGSLGVYKITKNR